MKSMPIVIVMLLVSGCSVLEPDTPLQAAASHNDVARLKELLKSGADVNEIGAHGITAVAAAARAGALDAIRFLAMHGADLNRQCGVNGWTPLMHAIHKRQLESVRALLDAGASIDARSRDHSTALMMASGYGYTEIVKLLLDRGANPKAQLSDGMNALSFAVLGTPDIDRFTVGDCQASTVGALLAKAPDLKIPENAKPVLRAAVKAKLKVCAAAE